MRHIPCLKMAKKRVENEVLIDVMARVQQSKKTSLVAVAFYFFSCILKIPTGSKSYLNLDYGV